MGCLGNLIWLIFGGLVESVGWFLYGCLWCITIVGIPIGVQCFKFAELTLAPFGKEVVIGTGFSNAVLNIIWIAVTGIPMAITNAIWGLVFCCTVVGIPFGLQFFKLAKLSLFPFGAEIN